MNEFSDEPCKYCIKSESCDHAHVGNACWYLETNEETRKQIDIDNQEAFKNLLRYKIAKGKCSKGEAVSVDDPDFKKWLKNAY